MFLAVATIVVSPMFAAPANADPGDACVTSYEGAQAARKRGELVRSKAELRLCLGACPGALAKDCGRWLDEVSKEIGRLTVEVRDRANGPVPTARLLVDGVERPSGEVLELDPGTREITAEGPGYARRTVRVELASGSEAKQIIRLDAAPSPAADPAQESPSLTGPLVLGGAGLAALIAAAALAIAGHVDVESMKDECAPRCPQSRVDTVADLWTAGGIVGGLGSAAVIGSGVWLGLSLTPPEPTASAGRGAFYGLGLGGRF